MRKSDKKNDGDNAVFEITKYSTSKLGPFSR